LIALQLMDYMEKLSNNEIGFTFTNNILITRRTFKFVSIFSLHKILFNV